MLGLRRTEEVPMPTLLRWGCSTMRLDSRYFLMGQHLLDRKGMNMNEHLYVYMSKST